MHSTCIQAAPKHIAHKNCRELSMAFAYKLCLLLLRTKKKGRHSRPHGFFKKKDGEAVLPDVH